MDQKKRTPCIELLDPAMVEVLRRKTPAERVAMVFDIDRTLRLIQTAHLQTSHPDWTAAQINAEIARRRLHGTG